MVQDIEICFAPYVTRIFLVFHARFSHLEFWGSPPNDDGDDDAQICKARPK